MAVVGIEFEISVSLVPNYFSLGKPSKRKIREKLRFYDPLLGPNLRKNWNVDYFDIFAPPLTVSKLSDPGINITKILSNCHIGTIYHISISIIYQSYMYQYITHILSKSRPCIFEKFENPEQFSCLTLNRIFTKLSSRRLVQQS